MVNNLQVYLGRRGSGKSTLAASDAQQAAGDDVMVIVHDAIGGFPSHVGPRVGSLNSLRAIAEAGSISICSGCELGELALWMRRVSPKMENGSLLLIDEGVLLTTSEKREHMMRRIREMAATARHSRMRLAIVAQGSMLIDHTLVSMADRAAFFGLVGGYEKVKLEQCGIPRLIVERLPELPDFQYYRGVPGRPWSEWNLYSTRPRKLS